jgi:hypothetical protein
MTEINEFVWKHNAMQRQALVAEPEHVNWRRDDSERGIRLPDEFRYTSDHRGPLLTDKEVERVLVGMHGASTRASESSDGAPLVRLPAEVATQWTGGN